MSHTSSLTPESAFSFPPIRYNPARDQELIDGEHRAQVMYRSTGITNPSHSPMELLQRWTDTPLGEWQGRQTARYPTFHQSLDEILIPEAVDPNEFRASVLKMMAKAALWIGARDTLSRQSLDLHPIGHMARALTVYDTLLFDGTLDGHVRYPQYIPLSRDTLALHDIGEVSHPGIEQVFGGTVGDIPSNIGKTAIQRALEADIFSGSLQEFFSDDIDSETREIMTQIVTHTPGADLRVREAHALTELAHHVNSAYTGNVMADIACAEIEANPARTPQANILMLLADQTERSLRPKFQRVLEESPRLHGPIKYVIDTTMGQLIHSVHARDEDTTWVQWRQQFNDHADFGVYEPVDA